MTPDDLAQRAMEWGSFGDEEKIYTVKDLRDLVSDLASAYLAQREEIERLHTGAMISVQIEQRATDVRAERDKLREEIAEAEQKMAIMADDCTEHGMQHLRLRDLAEERELAALRERDELRAENTRIRAALAMSERPCVYCSLPADEWGKCKSGWPGCARSDDALGCPHLGDSMELDDLRAKLRRAKGLHVEDPNWGGCAQCDKDWPCPTRMALSGEP